MSKLICPQCGAEVILPEKSSFITGVTLAENTDNNTYYLNTKENSNMGKISERLETLKNNGIDVSKFFSVSLPNGDEIAMKMDNGVPVACNLDEYFNDDIESEIYANGYVKNTKLHRRWVMAQMFHALNYKAPKWNKMYGDGFNGWLRSHGYDYQWTMVIEELRVMNKLKNSDYDAYKERNMFFNKNVVISMLEDYLDKLQKYINKLPVHKCKGIPYKKIYRFGNIFCEDIDRKIYDKIRRSIFRIKHVNDEDVSIIYYELKYFYHNTYIRVPNISMSPSFIDAYKGSGSYYTLKNLIMFHNVDLIKDVSKKRQLNYLYGITETYMEKRGGYRLFACMKQVIDENNFDFDKRMTELYN